MWILFDAKTDFFRMCRRHKSIAFQYVLCENLDKQTTLCYTRISVSIFYSILTFPGKTWFFGAYQTAGAAFPAGKELRS